MYVPAAVGKEHLRGLDRRDGVPTDTSQLIVVADSLRNSVAINFLLE